MIRNVAWTVLACLLFVTRGVDSWADERPAADRLASNHSLLAHWTFDEASGELIKDALGNDGLSIRAAIPHARGVCGNALELSGSHQLRVPPPAAEERLEQIAFSAWVKPVDLSSYREIYRQECPERVLFSFQNNGTILSLGLNISGYVECDAAINPAQVLDGAWHHAAASFDGDVMRVYLDGCEIGHLDRSGTLQTNPQVPAYIASSGGRSEHFQGSLDELQIYREALSGEEVVEIYQHGTMQLAARLAEYQQQQEEVYHREGSFAKTLARLRQAVAAHSLAGDREFLGLLVARLRTDFPDDCRAYSNVTGKSPVEYLSATNRASLAGLVGHYVEMMQEYMPLTQRQRSRLSPAEMQHWAEVAEIARRFEQLRSRESDDAQSAEWIELLLAAAGRVLQRPAVSEAVAPYRTPTTPETRSLSSDQAHEVLRRDWLHQAGGAPDKGRVLAEIGWTRELAARLVDRSHGQLDLSEQLLKLNQLEASARQLAGDATECYCAVRGLKRSIALQNPAVDFSSVLFVDMPMPSGSEWRHETRHRLGYMAVPGARLLVLDGLAPDGQLRQLMPQAPLHGSFWRPDLSYDARKVLFCFKPHNEKSFHLYEMNLDGTDLVQLTEGPYDDLDPIYLPDGQHIMFSTTRGHTYVRCMPPTNAFVLARCDANGENIYLVSRNNEPDYLPSVLPDGRVIYTRWEYTDKPLWRAQGLWTVNPDGTQVNTLWGNQSVWPDLLKDARAIPRSRRIMFTGSAHHDWFSGSVGIIDPLQGFNFPNGLTKVTADVPWPESGNGPVDPIESTRYHASGRYEAYYSPLPLSEEDFLVSANRAGKFVLYLMDIYGNRELIYEGTHHVLHAIPIRPRSRPPVIPDRVAWPSRGKRLRPESGVIYSSDVYQGAPENLRGKARYLRVLNIEPKTYTYWYKRPYISTGPVVSAVQSEGVKRVLGTVPIHSDGSVSFHAPAGMALHFQLLDERYRALQTMRSFTGVMPGEQRGCLGCHESHSRAPEYRGSTLALAQDPATIEPPPWGDESISYARFVRPVLDRYCAECHEGNGEAREVLDLTARPGFLIFEEPYLILTGRPAWGKPYQRPPDQHDGFGIANMLMVEGYDQRDPAAYRTPDPMTHLSYRSPLIEIASSGDHYGVQVDPESLRRLIAWVDTMCPYRGSEEVRQIDDPDFQGVDWLSIRPRIKTAPTIVRPGPVDDQVCAENRQKP